MVCVLCLSPINKSNNSDEHVIGNAIGGRKTLRNVLCAPCNTTSGHTWDQALASSLNPLSLILGIRRHRGEVPSQVFQTTDGKSVRLNADGTMAPVRPERKITELGDAQVRMEFMARNVDEAKQMLEGTKRKYKNIDVEAGLKAVVERETYLEHPLQFSLELGGPLACRSVVKSALCFAADRGVPAELCIEARAYLVYPEAPQCFGYYTASDLVIGRPSGLPIHCIAVSNRGTRGQLLAYVEFFGVQRYLIRLAQNFTEGEVHNVYAMDPTTGEDLELDVNLELSREEVEATYRNERAPAEKTQEAFGLILGAALKRVSERELNRVVTEAVRHAAQTMGIEWGDAIPPERSEQFSRLMLARLEPFLRSRVAKRVSAQTPKNDSTGK